MTSLLLSPPPVLQTLLLLTGSSYLLFSWGKAVGERQRRMLREKEEEERIRREEEERERLVNESTVLVNGDEAEAETEAEVGEGEEKEKEEQHVNGLPNGKGESNDMEKSTASPPPPPLTSFPHPSPGKRSRSSSPIPPSSSLEEAATETGTSKDESGALARPQAPLLHPTTHSLLLPRPPLPSHPSPSSTILEGEGEVGVGEEGGLGEGRRVDSRTERQYLTLSWWLVNRGWREVESRSKQTQIPPHSLSPPSSFPPPSLESSTLYLSGLSPADCVLTPSLSSLLSETRDFLDSPDFSLVSSLLIDKAFDTLLKSIEPVFRSPPAERHEGEEEEVRSWDAVGAKKGVRFQEVGGREMEMEKSVRLASLLPTVARQSREMVQSIPNEWVEALAEVREMKEWAAVVYSAFEEEE
ncbi:hypothetical protein BT69DRAFT_1320303 [Atractiella rhizophila]|nr:hypothetical protein BT69DRAFT_1320303 [Atractiella rhizophila]